MLITGGDGMEEQYDEAIKRANRLGGKGIRVIGCFEPGDATGDGRVKFVVETPNNQRATENPWYED